LKSGPLNRDLAENELQAWRLFFDNNMVAAILKNANRQSQSLKSQLAPTENNLMLYLMFILAMGIVSYPEEGMIFQKDKHGGLTENEFLKGIFSHKQLQAAKKLFFASRGDLTTAFNAASQKNYALSQ
jgi:hypothetical protein